MEIKIRRKNNHLFLLSVLVLLTFFITSCNKKAVVEDYRSLKHAEWNQDTILVFEFNIPDPKKLYDLSFTVRNEGHYAYSNLWIFVAITPPSGKELTDTVELTLAKPSGEWLGSGLGDLYDRKYPYKKTIFFSRDREIYHFGQAGNAHTNRNPYRNSRFRNCTR